MLASEVGVWHSKNRSTVGPFRGGQRSASVGIAHSSDPKIWRGGLESEGNEGQDDRRGGSGKGLVSWAVRPGICVKRLFVLLRLIMWER